MHTIIRFTTGLIPILLPISANAQITVTGPASGLTAAGALNNIILMLASSGWIICGAIFLLGAFLFMFGGASTEMQGRGKGIMIGAIIGAIVIGGAAAIMNTVLYFVYYA